MRKEYDPIVYKHPEKRYENKLASNFEVLIPLRFLYDLKLELDNAKQRVLAQAMHLNSGYFVDAIISWFGEAAQKGLDVRLNIDTSSRLGKGDRVYYQDKFTPTKGADLRLFQYKRDEELLENLQKKGAKLTFTNPPDTLKEHIFPMFFGRDHRKMVIVDNVAYIGGLNLADANFKSADFVVKITDPQIVTKFTQIFGLVNDAKPKKDFGIYVNDQTNIFVDRGKRGESLILDTAAKIVANARHSVRAVTILAPDGKLLSALCSAQKRGVYVEDITSDPKGARNLFGAVNIANLTLMYFWGKDIPLRFFQGDLHAKLLLVDIEDPEKAVALFGSHNLATRGVQLGTLEISIMSRNPILIANLKRFYDSLSSSSKPNNPILPITQ